MLVEMKKLIQKVFINVQIPHTFNYSFIAKYVRLGEIGATESNNDNNNNGFTFYLLLLTYKCDNRV